ncbi:Cfr10I/Bse634I family restriction endonuclease [Kiritimatiellota bacterium B12222]|nr:Cfr10I/Bse634I family restriction endonuclease [Kiritimatiellota bacterium B12222]
MTLPAYLTQTRTNIQISSKEAFCELFEIGCTDSISDQLENADRIIRSQAPGIAQGAFNNVHGSWYEWILATRFWNHFLQSDSSILAAKLPNITGFDVADLFDEKLRAYILDLRQKVLEVSSVELVTSNPDFVMYKPNQMHLERLRELPPIHSYSVDGINFLERLYEQIVGQCNFITIIGFIATKTSFRPDRRLQIPHEGSLMKAIYAHLVTREWVLNPRGLKYFALACHVGDPDRRALKTVATHSITTVTDLPKAAVDEVYQVNSLGESDAFLQTELIYSL